MDAQLYGKNLILFHLILGAQFRLSRLAFFCKSLSSRFKVGLQKKSSNKPLNPGRDLFLICNSVLKKDISQIPNVLTQTPYNFSARRLHWFAQIFWSLFWGIFNYIHYYKSIYLCNLWEHLLPNHKTGLPILGLQYHSKMS